MKKSANGSLLLSEMLLAIMFFALAAAICLGVFASAKGELSKAQALSRAVIEAQSAAECFKAAGGNPQQYAAALGGSAEENGATLYFDKQWQTAQTGDFSLRLRTVSRAGGLARGEIVVYNDKLVLYALEVAVPIWEALP